MNKTPRTEAFASSCMTNRMLIIKHGQGEKANMMEMEFVLALEHARQLETDLTAARAKLDKYDRAVVAAHRALNGGSDFVQSEARKLCAELANRRGNYDPNETPEQLAERLKKIREFVDEVNDLSTAIAEPADHPADHPAADITEGK